MKIKIFLLIAFYSLLLFLAIAPLRSAYWGGFPTSSLVGYVCYFVFTIWCLNKYKEKSSIPQILFAILIGHWLLELPIRIIAFRATLISLPDSLIHCLGILGGFLFLYLQNPMKTIIAVFGILFVLYMYFQGWDFWVYYIFLGR